MDFSYLRKCYVALNTPIKSFSSRLFIYPVSMFLLLVSCKETKQPNVQLKMESLPEVKIGKQVWSTRNLELATFRNGDSIPYISSAEEWEKAGKEGRPAWCYYNNDPSTLAVYGRMYNWYALNDPRGICPDGWRIPTNDEWIALEEHLGTEEAAVHMKAKNGWDSNGNGDDSVGFALYPGGYRDRNGSFTGMGLFTYLSGITEDRLPESKDDKKFIWGRGVHAENKTVMRCGLDKEFGLYVRCVKIES